ncbi:BGTF surface domain-containing protein [Halostagnicola kamekurae]|uniref:PGF-CTERM protein/surface glycoprotein n=1 Tax=Halostagnicola kamekurae TaxID=619731 RepID=A0A1I6Q416_9EURY|nr:BGTF surface domain-containing protein [Halostagnicola kamekurae]SFS47216.1 PGF-CTERM protein/surface glycoprotein [Halostagnicola kamekurae]
MTNDTTYREKGRSLFLAAMLVLSVVAASAAFAGGAAAHAATNSDNYNEGPAYTNSTSFSEVWIGQQVEFTDFDDGQAGVKVFQGLGETGGQDSDAEPVTTLRVDSEDNNATLDTSELESGEPYTIVWGENEYTSFWAEEENLNTEFTSDTVAEDGEVDIDFNSDRDTQTVNVTSDSLNGNELFDLFDPGQNEELADGDVNFEGLYSTENTYTNGENTEDSDINVDNTLHDDDDVLTIVGLDEGDEALTANFDGELSAGDEAEFTFSNTDSHASDNASVEITDDSQQREIINVDTIEEGDIGNITIDVANSDETAVSIGDDSEGYVANLTLGDYDTDNDEVVLEFNTYKAGAADGGQFNAAGDNADEIGFTAHNATITGYDLNTELDDNEALPAATWDIEVGSFDTDYAADFIDESDDRASLVIQDRGAPGDVIVQTAPTGDSFTDFGDFEDGDVSETDTIATESATNGDHLFVTIEDFGANGSVDALTGDGSAINNAFFDRTGVSLNISEQDAGVIGSANYWNTSILEGEGPDNANNITVTPLIDADEYDSHEEYAGDLILKVDYQSLEGDAQLDVDDKAYDVNFSVDSDKSNILDEDFSTESDVTFEEAELEWDDVSEMPANAESNATGTTNLAPGTEIDTTADSPSEEGSFVDTATAEVNDDGTFEASHNLEGEMVGSLFDLEASGSLGTSDTAEDVELVESTEPDEEGLGLDVEAGDITVNETATFDVTVSNYEGSSTTADLTLENADGEEVDTGSVDIDADGTADATLEASGLSAGDHTFTVTADDGDFEASEEVTLTVNEEGSGGDDGSSDDGSSDDGSSDDGSSDDGSSDDGSSDDGGDGEGDGAPGFGVAVALVALVSAAMLALRRQN